MFGYLIQAMPTFIHEDLLLTEFWRQLETLTLFFSRAIF